MSLLISRRVGLCGCKLCRVEPEALPVTAEPCVPRLDFGSEDAAPFARPREYDILEPLPWVLELAVQVPAAAYTALLLLSVAMLLPLSVEILLHV